MTSNRERFEAWYLAEYWQSSEAGRELLRKESCGGYTYAKPQELWKVWQAAQPADGEPVAWITRPLRGSSKGKAVMCQADHTPNLELWEKPFPVYAAPPAAAHGDEAVRKDAARYQALRNTPEIFIGVAEGDDMVFLKSPDQLDQLADNAAAMRAQGDGDEE